MSDENAPRAGLRILLVEDDDDTRDLVVEWLTREGYSVDGFGDAEAALPGLRRRLYSAVITDNNLPGMTGAELVRLALGEALIEPTQVVIASSLPPLTEAKAMGVGTLRKPVDLHTLLERLERLLAHDAATDLAPRSSLRPAVHLLLYVSVGSAASARAQRAAWHLANRPGAEHVHLEVRDVAEHPDAATAHRIAFTPTLLRIAPEPFLRIIGDLRDEAFLLDAISVWPSP